MTYHWVRSWPLEDLYFCKTETGVSDIDGNADIDSLWVWVPALNQRYALTYDPMEKIYTYTIWAESLPGGKLEILCSKPFYFYSWDLMNGADSSGPFYISRIIYPYSKSIFPGGWQDTVPDTFNLIWSKFREGYGTNYYIGIVQIDPTRVVYTYATNSIEDTTHHVSTPISPGNYYWTVAVKDEYGNVSRYKETAFVVRR